MKNYYFKIQVILLIVIGSIICLAQSQTVVGSISGGSPSLSVNIDTLKNAFNTEFNDGTVCNNVSILQTTSNGTYWLVGFCTNSSLYRTVRVELQVVNTNQVLDCQYDCGYCYVNTCTCVNAPISTPCTFKTNNLTTTNHLGSFY